MVIYIILNTVFINYLKRSLNFITTIKILYTRRCLINLQSCFPSTFLCRHYSKAQNIKYDTSRFIQSLNNLISREYNVSTEVESLRQVFFEICLY